MGARQSGTTRTVSMENNSPIIDVSEAVAQRLKNGLKAEAISRSQQQQQQQQQVKSIATEETSITKPITTTPATAAATTTAERIIPSRPSSYTNPTPYPPGILYAEPTITAMEIQRQKEIELNKNDAYWRNRLLQIEQTLNKTNAILEQEYTTAIESVRKKFHNAAPIHQLPPCQDLKAQVIACYRANRGESLRCSEEVAAFTNCVSENRVRKLDEQEKQQQQQKTQSALNDDQKKSRK